MAGRAYEFVLRQESGRYDKNAVLSFPSVTTIVGAVYAKPELGKWMARQMMDSVAQGLMQFEKQFRTFNPRFIENFLDTLSDFDMFEEWIRESKIHPDDVTNEAANRGTEAHALLASLATMHQLVGQKKAIDHAKRTAKASKDPYRKSVAGWWAAAQPLPIFTEKVVVNLGLRYAGRLDLGIPGTIIDLKTRRADLGTYKSDEMQTALYKLAAADQGLITPDFGTAILLAGDDGEPARLVPTWVPDEAAIQIVKLYWLLRRTDSTGRKVR